jgi:hypothetical protein
VIPTTIGAQQPGSHYFGGMTPARIESRDSLALHPVVPRELAVTGAAWAVIALVAIGLRVMRQLVTGQPVVFTQATGDIWMIAQWAAATPFVLRSARLLPVRGDRAARHALAHIAIGSAFIVVSNVIIRLPQLWQPLYGARGLAINTLLGLATYYPTAIISYGVLVAIGHRAFGPAAPRATGEPETKHIDDLSIDQHSEPEEPRLVIREWNRVHFIALDDIECVEADNHHVVVHANGRSYKGRERISDVETRLDARRFVRVHRSAIVQLAKIREVQPLMHGDQAIIMRSGRIVRVARGRRRALETALGTEL